MPDLHYFGSITLLKCKNISFYSIFLLFILLSACSEGGGGGSEDNADTTKSAVINNSSIVAKQIQIASGSLCPNGGIELKTGIDSNQNALLDDAEVTNTQNVCHGKNGEDGINGNASLIEIIDEPAGEYCPNGGIRFNIGIDADANGALSSLEITDFQVICHGTSGSASVGALSDKSVIKGSINRKVSTSSTSTSSTSTSSTSTSSTSTSSGELLLVPSDIEAGILQHQQNSNAQQPQPVTSTIAVPVDEQGNYEVEVPAGADYSLILVDEQGTNGVKIDNVAVGAGETLVQNINEADLIPTGGIRFNIASLASGAVLENAQIKLLALSTNTATDSVGAGEFNNVPEGTYALVVSKYGFVSKYITLKVNSGGNTDLKTIELNNQKGSAFGQIQAEGLTNQANLVVYARAADDSVYSTLTNASGIFSFPVLPVGENYSFIVAANDFESTKIDNIQITKEESTSLGIISLKRIPSDLGSLSGYARFAETTEAKHAGIIVSVEGTDKEAITSRDGAYIINGLPAGEYTLNFTESNHVAVTLKTIKVVATSTTSLAVTEMQGYIGAVTGIIQLPDGQALSGVTVSASNGEVTTDEIGQFTLTNMLVGEQKLSIYKTGFVTQDVFVEITVNTTLELSEALQLQPFQFSGSVILGEDISDHSGVQVVLDGLSNITTFTDAAGQFSFAGAVPGNYQITLSKNGFKTRSLVVTLPENDPVYVLPYNVKMVLSYGVLKGQVTLQNATDHSGTAINLSGTSYSTFTDSSGQWGMSIPEGSYAGGLQFSQSGYASQSDDATLDISAENVVEVALVNLNRLTGNVSGLVQDESGVALVGAQITEPIAGVTTISASDGSFTLSNIAVGSYDLNIALEGYVNNTQNVTITSGETTDLSATPIQLTAYSFSGSISLGEDVIDHSGVQVLLDGSSNLTIITDESGNFSFTGAAPGNYQLTFSKAGYSSQSLSISISSNESNYVLPYSITLRRLEGIVKGVAILSDQTGHSGVLVEIIGTSFATTTNAPGEWSMRIPVGNYSDGIRYTKSLYQSVLTEETFTVTDHGDYVASSANLTQTSALVSLNATAIGSCPEVNVSFSGMSGTAVGYSANFTVDQQGDMPVAELPLGGYTVTVSCSVSGWESYTFNTTLNGGVLGLALEAVALRQSFVKINNEDINTNNSRVVLTIGNTDALEMRIEEGISDSNWIAFSENYNHILSAGDGEKTVTVRFRDSSGVELSSVQDTIKLDTTLNVISFTAAGANTKGDLLHFLLDLNGELNANVIATVNGLITGLPLIDNGFGGDREAGDGIYERDYLISSPIDINQLATASVTDAAGNTLSINTTENVVLNTAPTISNLVSSSNVSTGEMTIQFSTDEPATAIIEYGDNLADPTNIVEVSTIFTTSHSTTLKGLSPNSITYYQIKVIDSAENTGQLNGQGKLAPAPVIGLGAYPGNSEVGLIWDLASNAVGYKIYRSSDGGTVFTLANSSALVTDRYYIDSFVKNGAAYIYRVTSVDVDGNESEEGIDVTVTPNVELAGPTEIAGGIIDTNMVWLKSRAPYQVSANFKVNEGVELLLLPGTEISFTQPDIAIHLSGVMSALGQSESKVVINAYDGGNNNYSGGFIFDRTNQALSSFNYSELNNLKIHSDSGNVPLVLKNSTVNGFQSLFHIRSANDTIFNKTISNSSSNYSQVNIGSVTNTVFNVLDEAGDPTTSLEEIARISSAMNSTFNGGKIYFNWNGSIDSCQFSNATIENVQSITDSILSNTTVRGNSSSLRMSGNTLTNSTISNSGRLVMHYSVLDSASTVTGTILDISHNYWGSTDLNAILVQTGYSPDKDQDTHLYPVITTSLLYTADWDKDGIPDYIDYDNDNDGYSDLQEDWTSAPDFFRIYNPLDDQSHPETFADNDMDGLADTDDVDDDNDGLTDTNEQIRLTDPFLADSDGDGVNDGDEVRYKFNPLDRANYPFTGKISGKTIDSSNVNSDGAVYLVGSVSFNNVTVLAGTAMMIDKDSQATFSDSVIAASPNNVITFRGAGSLSFNNSKVDYANINIGGELYNYSGSVFDHSDLSFSSGSVNGVVRNSLIHAKSSFSNSGIIEHSYLRGSLRNYKTITSSYIASDISNSGNVISSYVNNIGIENKSIVIGSVVNGYYSYSSTSSEMVNSDVRLNSGMNNIFFDNSYIHLGYGGHYYGGYGEPIDQLGDGVAETVFEVENYDGASNTSTFTVDGINNPRSAPNFPGLIFKPYLEAAPIWSPTGVGAWWDMNNAHVFPDSDPSNTMGTISGQVNIAGYNNHSGVRVELTNTSLWTTTNAEGNWSIRLPSRDYTGGISFTKDYLATALKSRSYSVESQVDTAVGLVEMEQITAQVSGVLTIDEANDYSLATITATKSGQVTKMNASASGEFKLTDLPLGNYEFAITYPDGSWETVTHELILAAGQTEYSLPLTRVRNSFVYINSGATYTNSLNVTLAITNASAANMQITEGGNTQDSVAYANSSNLILSSGEGEKNVQVTFTDADSNVLTPATSSIILDTQVALSSLELSEVSTMSDILHITLTANEQDGSALVTIPGLVSDLELFDNGVSGDAIAGDGIYEIDYVINTAEDITAYATANFIDRAGNSATINSTSQLAISTSPTISELLAQTVNGQLQISFTTNEFTTATIVYGTDPNNLDQSMTVSASEATDHIVSLPASEGQTIYYQVTTDDGVTLTTAVSSSSTISNAALTGLSISAGHQEVGLVWNEQNWANNYRIYRSDDSNTFVPLATISAETNYYVDDSVSNDQAYYYRITWIDQNTKESDQTASVSASASLLKSGPTELEGGVIAINEIWLQSRSPYIISGNMLIRKDATLRLMQGTEIEFNGASSHIMTRGNIMAYGSAWDRVKISTDSAYSNASSRQSAIIYDTTNTTESEFNYTELNYMQVYYDYSDWDTRENYLVPLTLSNSVINGYNGYQANFFIRQIENSTFNEYGYGTSRNYLLRIGTLDNSILRKVDASGDLSNTNNYIARIDNTNNTDLLGAGFMFAQKSYYSSRGSIQGGSIINSRIVGIAEIKNATITNSEFGFNTVDNNSLRLTESTITNSHFNLTGDNTRLTMHYNVLDSDSSVSAKTLDISYNYWGNTDLATIAQQTGYSPVPAKDTHLYPIITGSLLYEADWDNDGLPDYLDYDNDNDGYSDLQEDWESDPVYASIYNPLDDTSYPSTDTNNDMDSLKDSEDLDDDNDGLLDTDEPTYGTDPFLADSDGDGINDGDEVRFKYNPLDKTNYPLMGNISGKTLDNSNVNSDGVVYIVGYGDSGAEAGKYVSLDNISVAPGTALMIEKDTHVTLTDSRIEGDSGNVITVRSTGAGNGGLSLNNTHVAYANIKLAISVNMNSKTTIDRSDLSLSGGNFYGFISNSFIHINSYIRLRATIEHSYIDGNHYNNYGVMTSSYSNTPFSNYGEFIGSYAKTLYSQSASRVEGSVINDFSGSGSGRLVSGSDIKLSSGTMTNFFDNTFIANSAGTFYDGYGSPVDQLGDGVAETVFTIDSSTYTVDGINNPRSTKNFPNGADDLWNPAGVGALWDPNAVDPSLFPEPAL